MKGRAGDERAGEWERGGEWERRGWQGRGGGGGGGGATDRFAGVPEAEECLSLLRPELGPEVEELVAGGERQGAGPLAAPDAAALLPSGALLLLLLLSPQRLVGVVPGVASLQVDVADEARMADSAAVELRALRGRPPAPGAPCWSQPPPRQPRKSQLPANHCKEAAGRARKGLRPFHPQPPLAQTCCGRDRRRGRFMSGSGVALWVVRRGYGCRFSFPGVYGSAGSG